jgi:hypothetical protein
MRIRSELLRNKFGNNENLIQGRFTVTMNDSIFQVKLDRITRMHNQIAKYLKFDAFYMISDGDNVKDQSHFKN